MVTGESQRACHGVLVHIDQAPGGSCPAAFLEVFQDGQGLMVGQASVFEDGPLAFGEGVLAGTAVDHADSPALATPTTKVEVFTASDAGLGAVGILATQMFDGDHGSHPCS